jgi:hypothetical protein
MLSWGKKLYEREQKEKGCPHTRKTPAHKLFRPTCFNTIEVQDNVEKGTQEHHAPREN